MVACVREGPGVRFTKAGVTVDSGAVSWAGCLLPYDCQGRNQERPSEKRFLWLGAVHSCWFGWKSAGPSSANHGQILLKFEHLKAWAKNCSKIPVP